MMNSNALKYLLIILFMALLPGNANAAEDKVCDPAADFVFHEIKDASYCTTVNDCSALEPQYVKKLVTKGGEFARNEIVYYFGCPVFVNTKEVGYINKLVARYSLFHESYSTFTECASRPDCAEKDSWYNVKCIESRCVAGPEQ